MNIYVYIHIHNIFPASRLFPHTTMLPYRSGIEEKLQTNSETNPGAISGGRSPLSLKPNKLKAFHPKIIHKNVPKIRKNACFGLSFRDKC